LPFQNLEMASIVYVISQLIFGGGREIAQERSEILPKVFWENFVSSKFHQNCNTKPVPSYSLSLSGGGERVCH